MQHSESLANLAPALAKAQAKIEPAPRSADNPHFGSKYTPLPVVWQTVKPALVEHGFSVVQTFSPDAVEGYVNVVTTLLHESGEWISGTLPFPMPRIKRRSDSEPPPVNPQAAGSAITYARRYSLAAIVGVVSEEDDDAEAAMGKPPKAGDTVGGLEDLL